MNVKVVLKYSYFRDLKAALNAIQPQGAGEDEGESEDRKRKREDEKESAGINGKD